MATIIGRHKEIAELNEVYKSNKAEHRGIKYVLSNAHVLDEPIYGKNKATPLFYNVDGYDDEHLPPAHKVEV